MLEIVNECKEFGISFNIVAQWLDFEVAMAACFVSPRRRRSDSQQLKPYERGSDGSIMTNVVIWSNKYQRLINWT